MCLVHNHEKHRRGLKTRANEAVNEKTTVIVGARHGMTMRRDGEQRTLLESDVARVKSAVRNSRKEVKRFVRVVDGTNK